jgi:hypothetical protein
MHVLGTLFLLCILSRKRMPCRRVFGSTCSCTASFMALQSQLASPLEGKVEDLYAIGTVVRWPVVEQLAALLMREPWHESA